MIGLSIRRPVAVAMLYTSVALLGVAAWRNIPIELLPDTRLPRLSINAVWGGASPETVEAFLTSPLEATVQQVRGVETVTSVSEEGSARIEIEFDRSVDMDFTRLELAERVATLEEELPPGVGAITVEPYVPEQFSNQDQRFLAYTFSGPHTLGALRRYLEDEVSPSISQVEGVGFVRVGGGLDRVIEIELDPDAMTALGLQPGDVRERISDLDLVREAGAQRRGGQQWTVTIRNRPGSVLDFRSAVLLAEGGRLVRVSDVAIIRDTFEEARGHFRINGQPAVRFEVVKEIGSNSVRVAEAVRGVVENLEGRGPVGSGFEIEYDESVEIERQLTDLRTRALLSALVILVVLLVFLRSLRSTVVIFSTIAFSVLIALNLVYFGGYALNLLTLMGLAMGFGLIVDNSIVVLENVYRVWQRGARADEAAAEGSREVILPILASTATTLIVFLPFVYLQGELRVFYVPLAIVVGLTLLASLVVSFSFIPALSSRLLAKGKPLATVGGKEAAQPIYVRAYATLLAFITAHPFVMLLITAGAFVGSAYVFDTHVTRGVVWSRFGFGEDTYLRVTYELPRGADLERMDELVQYFEERLRQMPEVEEFSTQVTPQFAISEVYFPDSLENTGVPVAIKEQLTSFGLGFSGAEVKVYGLGPSFYGGGGSPPNYSIQVLGYNYETVRDIAEDLGSRLTRQPRVQEVDTNATGSWFNREKASEFVLAVDREALARYGLSVRDFVGRVRTAIASTVGENYVKVAGEEIRYEVRIAGNRELDVRALQEVLIESPDGTGIRLGDVMEIDEREVLSQIRREDQQYQRTVAYEFRGPTKLGDIIHGQVIAATDVPAGYTVKARDRFSWSDEERSQIYLVLLVSVGLIYMVTAALFESLKQPFCVLLTVPMALIGVFLIFFFRDITFTREAYVGVIMMGGIVVNNAILLVDRINRLRRTEGMGLEQAIVDGTLERVRPIFMTTATTVLGLLPLVLRSASVDSNIWNALAYALIGGLLSSTLFVLTTTPALYLLFERPRKQRARAELPQSELTSVLPPLQPAD